MLLETEPLILLLTHCGKRRLFRQLSPVYSIRYINVKMPYVKRRVIKLNEVELYNFIKEDVIKYYHIIYRI